MKDKQKEKKVRKHLKECRGLESKDIIRIKLLKAKNLSGYYKEQYEALSDNRLKNITIAIVPDNLWKKGIQPSEANPEKQLILVKESYYKNPDNPDEIAWIIHELAHCKKFLDSDSKEKYQRDMQTFTFKDKKLKYPYPNNKVEKFTFTEQFKFLKNQGKTKEDILIMLEKYYDPEDFSFFNKLLNKIYS